ncbi:signal peptidase I [Anaerolentibacter hominis]|uniref:signal peptidase I n=1 Tax=Anaerolentibacter hominis TaxID=3079009 RepID=UPI0031B84E47
MSEEIRGQLKLQLLLEKKKYRRRHIRRSLILTGTLTVILLGIVIIMNVVIGIDMVSGESMYPSLRSGDIIFYRRGGSLASGDVVVFQQDGEDLVKRVAAVPGDTVEIDGRSGRVIVNGQMIQEPYVIEADETEISIPLTVLDNHYFVLGDNREISVDSRDQKVGTVPADHIRGKVFLVLRRE